MERGQRWAYRQRENAPLVEVQVVREGTQRHPRVLIRFVDDEFEGKEEWVPPARLKVPWDDVDEFRACEERWARVSAPGPDDCDPRTNAVIMIFNRYLDDDVVEFDLGEGYATKLHRPHELAEMLGLRQEQLTDYPESFVEGGAVISPWPATELIASTAARLNADDVLRRLRADERKAQREAIQGRHTARGSYLSPEEAAETDAQFYRPMREVLRSWCGAENAPEREDRAERLRRIQERIHEQTGNPQASEDVVAACRRIIKGR